MDPMSMGIKNVGLDTIEMRKSGNHSAYVKPVFSLFPLTLNVKNKLCSTLAASAPWLPIRFFQVQTQAQAMEPSRQIGDQDHSSYTIALESKNRSPRILTATWAEPCWRTGPEKTYLAE